MNNQLNKLTESFSGNAPVNKQLFNEVISVLNFNLPADYLEFIENYNGGEGQIGKNGYLMLWPIENLLPYNNEYQFDVYAPKYFVFGKDAADTAFAFDKSDSAIWEFGFLANLETDPPKFCGKTFTDFLQYLYIM